MRSIRDTRAFVSFVCFIVLSGFAAAQDIDKALAAFKAGEWKKAAEVSANVPADSKDFAKAQYLCGETLLVLGDAAGAEKCFARVLEINPKAVPAATGRGRALTAESKLDEAEQALTRAIELDATNPGTKLALGELHLKMKKVKEAKAELGEAYDLDPKNPAVVRAWCDYLWSEGDSAKAAQVAANLTRVMPKHPMGPFLEGIAYEREGKDRKAIESYEEALKRDATFIDAHKNLAIVCHTVNPMYTDADRTKKALEHYERYFALGGKDPELQHLYEQFKGFMDQHVKGK